MTTRVASNRIRSTLIIVLIVLLGTILASRLAPHPLGPTRSANSFNKKASTTAKSAISELNTSKLVSQQAGKNAFGPYVSLVLSDCEESLSSLGGSFSSLQPPDAKSDHHANTLSQLLSTATDDVRTLRVTARRGEYASLKEQLPKINQDLRDLHAFLGDVA